MRGTRKDARPSAGHVIALDGLRGLAALMVFVHHVHLPGPYTQSAGLHAGVQVFFALSGYLLYRPFLGTVDVKRYATKRFLRIAPAYLLAAFGIAALWYPGQFDPIGILTMTRTPIEVVWTLRIEVVYYLVLPLVAFIPSERRVPVLFGIGCASVLWNVALLTTSPRSDAFTTLPSMAWAFVPGMLAAELRGREVSRWLVPLGVALIALAVWLDIPAWMDLPAAIGAGLLIAVLVNIPVRGRLAQLCAFGGAVSYAVYLWHMAVIEAVARPYSWAGAALAFALTLGIAVLSYVLVERPAMRLPDRVRADAELVARASRRWRVVPAVRR